MADDDIPPSPASRKAKKKKTARSRRSLKNISKNSVTAVASPISVKDRRIDDLLSRSMSHRRSSDASNKKINLYDSDSEGQQMLVCASVGSVFADALRLEMANIPAKKISKQDFNTTEGFYRLNEPVAEESSFSAIAEIQDATGELPSTSMLLPLQSETQFPMSGTQFDRICQEAEEKAGAKNIFELSSQWDDSPLKGLSNKRLRHNSSIDISSHEFKIEVNNISSPPNKISKTEMDKLLNGTLQLTAARNLEDFYESENSNTSCPQKLKGDFFAKESDGQVLVDETDILETTFLMNNPNQSQNILELSGVFSQTLTPNRNCDDDTIGGIFKYITKITSESEPFDLLQWYQDGEMKLNLDDDDCSEDFKGFEDSLSSCSLSTDEDSFTEPPNLINLIDQDIADVIQSTPKKLSIRKRRLEYSHSKESHRKLKRIKEDSTSLHLCNNFPLDDIESNLNENEIDVRLVDKRNALNYLAATDVPVVTNIAPVISEQKKDCDRASEGTYQPRNKESTRKNKLSLRRNITKNVKDDFSGQKDMYTLSHQLDNQIYKNGNLICESKSMPVAIADSSLLGSNSKNSFQDYVPHSGRINEYTNPVMNSTKSSTDDIKTTATLMTDGEQKNISTTCGFKAAIRQDMKTSAKTLQSTEDLMSGIHLDGINQLDFVSNKNFQSFGFKTAAGKNLKICEDSLAKAKNIMSDFDFDDISCNDNNIECKAFTTGFSSASNKAIKISNKSAKRANELFHEIDSDNHIKSSIIAEISYVNHITENLNNVDNLPPPQLCGFTSAGGKNLKISSEAFKRANTLFDGILSEFPETFPTAAGKSFKTTDEEMGKATNSNAETDLTISNPNNKIEEGVKSLSKLGFDLVSNQLLPEIQTRNKEIGSTRGMSESVGKTISHRNSPVTPASTNTNQFRRFALTKKFKAPAQISNGNYETPQKSTILASKSVSVTPNLKEFFSSVATSTPQKPSTTEFTNSNKETTASTLAPTNNSENFNDFSLGDDMKRIFWEESEVFFTNEVLELEKVLSQDLPSKDTLVKRKLIKETLLKRIEEKNESDVSISAGFLIVKKSQCNQIDWKTLVKGEKPKIYSLQEMLKLNVKNNIASLNPKTINNFRFKVKEHFPEELENTDGLKLADGATLMFDDENMIGFEELKTAFLSIPNVSLKLLPSLWTRHHLELIVLKLAAMEQAFPIHFGGEICNPENVLLQLKYRYDREIDRAERSCLRQILECDDSPAKPFVVYVSNIQIVNSQYEIELSDGWYKIRAIIDNEMEKLVSDKRIELGTKLLIQNAELQNCENGCDPLQVPDNVRLKIHTNSVRRVRWNGKLGWLRAHKGMPATNLIHILPKGGIVNKLEAIIVRIYPFLYLNKDKSERITSGFHSSKVEEHFRKLNEGLGFELIEKIFSQELKEVEKEKNISNKKSFSGIKNIKELQDIQELSEYLEIIGEDNELQAGLTIEQKNEIMKYRQSIFDRKMEEINARVKQRLDARPKQREVIEVLKIRIADPNILEKTATLTIWRPSEDLKGIFIENVLLEINNCTPNEFHSNELQLTTNNKSQFKILDRRKLLNSCEFTRKISTVQEIYNSKHFKPFYNEVDTFGFIVKILEAKSKRFQKVFLCDSKYNLICLNFWSGLKEYAYDDIVVCQKFIAVYNLQWRSNSTAKSIPDLYVTETSLITQNPRTDDMKNSLDKLKDEFLTIDMFKLIENIYEKINEYQNVIVDRTKSSTSLMSLNSSVGRNSIVSSNSFSYNSQSSKKICNVQERIDSLNRYYGGDPPATQLVGISKCRKSVRKAYKDPTKFDSTTDENSDLNNINR